MTFVGLLLLAVGNSFAEEFAGYFCGKSCCTKKTGEAKNGCKLGNLGCAISVRIGP